MSNPESIVSPGGVVCGIITFDDHLTTKLLNVRVSILIAVFVF